MMDIACVTDAVPRGFQPDGGRLVAEALCRPAIARTAARAIHALITQFEFVIVSAVGDNRLVTPSDKPENAMVAQPNSLAGRDVASVIHPYTNLEQHKITGPTVIAKGEGVYVTDDSGKKYLEGMAGLWSTSLGFSEKRLVQAAIRQMEQPPTHHIFHRRS